MCVCTSKADTTAQNCKIIYFVRYCNERKQRQFWVRSIFNTERKLQQGASDNLIKEMLAEDMEKYVDYFRMPSQIFEALLPLVGSTITKQYFIRDSISPESRFQILHCAIEHQENMKYLLYAFRVGHNTISKIISETCEAIWKCLKDSVFPKDDKESWKTVADEFERL
ncbi:hypothetical protein ALC56_02500 [Trachymyrmex septentrionalis]|uniref:Nuclease HARBI1 n=1 Tax=Trachymyrmex septentrionalis TaxID=34720 RepID=A0A151K0D0_9HYME|nr:hypothetical protein ALC56_02500 [Trachymyrmex septentrionalis]